MPKIRKKTIGAYQHGDLKESLLQAAYSLIKKNGEVDFTLRGLAKMVGVTPMAAYRHYESKEAILLEIARQGFEKLSSTFKQALANDPSNIQGIGISYVEFALENPVYFRVMFHPDMMVKDKSSHPRPEDEAAYQILLDCVSLNQAQGRFKCGDKDALAITAWSTVHGLASLLVNGSLEAKYANNRIVSKRVIEQTTAIILAGLIASV